MTSPGRISSRASAHADLRITDAQIREVLAIWSRMVPWDGRRKPLHGPLEIRPLGPKRLHDFLRFFDREAFMDNPIWGSCYCMSPHPPPEQFQKQSAAERQEAKRALIAGGQAQGLLAYAGGRTRTELPAVIPRRGVGGRCPVTCA